MRDLLCLKIYKSTNIEKEENHYIRSGGTEAVKPLAYIHIGDEFRIASRAHASDNNAWESIILEFGKLWQTVRSIME